MRLTNRRPACPAERNHLNWEASMRARFRRKAGRVVAAIESIAFKVIGENRRAAMLERMTEQMVKVVHLPEGSLKFLASSPLLLSRADTILNKEEDTIAWIKGFPSDSVFWDIGANVGVY